MHAVFAALAVAASWALANWQLLAILVTVFFSALNLVLPGHPRLMGFSRKLVSVLAAVPMQGGKSQLIAFIAAKVGPNLAGELLEVVSRKLDIPLLSKSVPLNHPSGAPAKVPPQLLAVLVCVGLFASGCAYVQATGVAIKTCAGQTVAAADWNDLKPLAAAALSRDQLTAFAQLAGLAGKYGMGFVDCVVAELREEYSKLLEQPPGARAKSAEASPSARAIENADAWLRHQ